MLIYRRSYEQSIYFLRFLCHLWEKFAILAKITKDVAILGHENDLAPRTYLAQLLPISPHVHPRINPNWRSQNFRQMRPDLPEI